MRRAQTLEATRCWLRDLRRRPLLLALLVVTPVLFITRAINATEPIPRRIDVAGAGPVLTTMRDIHGASMAAITVAFLGGLVGVFVMQAAREADLRLVLAGYRASEAVFARLAVLLSAVAVVVVVALAVTARDFTPHEWGWFAFATAAIGVTYAGLGALAGTLLGRVGATYLVLIGSMLDIGVVQNPMFGSGTPPAWGVVLPGYGPMRIVMSASFAHAGAPPAADIALTLLWSVGVLAVVVRVLTGAMRRSAVAPADRPAST